MGALSFGKTEAGSGCRGVKEKGPSRSVDVDGATHPLQKAQRMGHPISTRSFGDGAEAGGDVVADVESGVFHGGVVADFVDAGADALLDALADGPVLAVD